MTLLVRAPKLDDATRKHWERRLGSHLGWIFGAALLGKVVGLALARLFLVLDLRRLRRQLSRGAAVAAEARS